MEIRINGNLTVVEPPITVADLLRSLDCDREKVAVAVNQEFIPRSRHGATPLCEGDDVECVAPRQGG
jgi:sulfur carrier protein